MSLGEGALAGATEEPVFEQKGDTNEDTKGTGEHNRGSLRMRRPNPVQITTASSPSRQGKRKNSHPAVIPSSSNTTVLKVPQSGNPFHMV